MTVVDPGPRRTGVRLPSGETLAVAVDGRSLAAGETATLGIRAEDFVAPEQGEARLTAKLMVAEKLGYETLAHLQVEGVEGTVTQRLDGLAQLEEHQAVSLGLSGEHCHLFGPDGQACPRQVEIPGITH